MHTTTNTVAQYILALKNAQLQAKRAKNPIADEYLMMVATKAILSAQRSPRTDDVWEDLDECDKDWGTWQKMYLKADNKALTKRLVSGDAEQFGGIVGAAASDKIANTPATLGDVEGCFDSLTGVVGTDKSVIAELVSSNAALIKALATLTDANAKLTKLVETLTAASAKKGGGGGGGATTDSGGSGKGDTTYCPNCKRDTWHKPSDCFELEQNKASHPHYWKTCLKA